MKTRFTFISVLAVLFTAALAPVDTAKAVTIIKGPYLQQVTQYSIVIMWETDFASDSKVEYGSGHSVERNESVTIHEIELTNELNPGSLNPGETYAYKVSSKATLGGATVTSGTFTFATAPATEQTFRFVAYGNTRDNPDDHTLVIQAIINSEPEIVLNTGDLVGNGRQYAQWGPQYFTPSYELMIKTPVLPVLGNHEYYGSEQLWFFDFFSLPGNETPLGDEQWFAFTYGCVRFIGLNTNVSYSQGSDQYIWLVGELQSDAYNSATWHIVYFHHPPYTWTTSHTDEINVQTHLVPLFEDNGVDMVFNGHSHVYERYFHNGIYYIVTGGGGAPLSTLRFDDTEEPIRKVGAEEYHHCVIEVDVPSNSLTLSARYNNGQQFDGIEITRTAEASNPNPEDLAENVPVDTFLSWRAGISAELHNVYLGNTVDGFGNPILESVSQKQTATSYDPEGLATGTMYYWAVDELDEQGDLIAAGDVWSFTTDAPLPWSDGFESGSFAAGGWTTSGNASVSSKADYLSTYGAEIKGTAWIEKAVSTVGFSNINVTYVRKTKGLDTGEYLYVEWFDGNYWHDLEETKDTSWSSQDLTCGAGANNNAAFKVRFGTNASNSAEYAYVDDVEIYESTVVTPPELASNPNPADGASNVAVTAEMSWTAGAGAQSHDVHFGTIDPPPFRQNQSGTTFDPGILVNNTTYYWRIDENNSYGTTVGDPWSFTTQPAGSTVYVSGIAMDIMLGKKCRAAATVNISPTLEGATVVGDWYFKGVLRLSGATGVTDANGTAVLTSLETPAKTGDTFTFTVTDVVALGHMYDESQNVETADSTTVP